MSLLNVNVKWFRNLTLIFDINVEEIIFTSTSTVKWLRELSMSDEYVNCQLIGTNTNSVENDELLEQVYLLIYIQLRGVKCADAS